MLSKSLIQFSVVGGGGGGLCPLPAIYLRPNYGPLSSLVAQTVKHLHAVQETRV